MTTTVYGNYGKSKINQKLREQSLLRLHNIANKIVALSGKKKSIPRGKFTSYFYWKLRVVSQGEVPPRVRPLIKAVEKIYC